MIFLFHDIDEASFRQTYGWISSKYNLISLNQCVEGLKNGSFSSMPQNPAVITFDDARRGNLNLLKFEEEFDVRPVVFVSTGESRLDGSKYCSAEEVVLLKRIFDFGGHTRRHPKLPNLSSSEQFYEVKHGKDELEKLVEVPVQHFAYPYGLYSKESIRQVKKAGYESALTVDLGINYVGQDLFRLKRICLDDKMSFNELVVKSSGLWDYLFNRKALNRETYT